MNWDDRIISPQEIGSYTNGKQARTLAEQVAALIEQQKRAWPLLSEGYKALREIETKRLPLADSEVIVQHNPKRIQSTTARVDKSSIESRRCFLCADNLPPEEKALAYGKDLLILCNPFPILDRHLSIVHREHVPQQIEGNIETLLDLARDLGGDYFALYNGPQCGASAPDHLHFQACSRATLPIRDCLNTVGEASELELLTVERCGRSAVVLRGADRNRTARALRDLLEGLAVETAKTEPLINIIATCDQAQSEPRWTVYLFPRARHRPAAFFAEGSERLLISPGAIDMAGIVIAPEHGDFLRVDAEAISKIFAEVSMDDKTVERVIARIARSGIEEGSK